MTWEIREGDALTRLREMPDESVHCVVTSPPYWGLRDYGVAGQLGLESTPEEYTAALVGVFREVRRVLRDDGTLWLNLGDSYASDTKGSGGKSSSGLNAKRDETGTVIGKSIVTYAPRRLEHGIKTKDLVGIPWRVFFALQADGWWLRSDIIWHKPNPMPESVTDRPTKAHEYVGLFAKAQTYFYDADAIAEASVIGAGAVRNVTPRNKGADESRNDGDRFGVVNDGTRNKRSVWPIATSPYPEAHFATFPPELPELCIRAGTSEKGCCPMCGAPWERVTERVAEPDGLRNRGAGAKMDFHTRQTGSGQKLQDWLDANPKQTVGWAPTCDHGHEPVPCTVLDPFAGAGTTGLVATRLGRHFIGIELNPTYANMARRRIDADCPLFNRDAS